MARRQALAGARLLERVDPSHVRNICVLAHVDHGKTTLTDSLVSQNGIVSQRLAGKVRYMDSTPEEQQRGITMKSSAISLQIHLAGDPEPYLVNLIDSPGHVDFSSEVSTAVRLSDGGIVVVDVVEGVCVQTQAVLRQSWKEGVRPVLVLNKLDRLITERQLSPAEAYQHLKRILEQVNVLAAELFQQEMFSDAEAARRAATAEAEAQEEGGKSGATGEVVLDAGVEDRDDSGIYFSPEAGNVVFASAIDGWGFGIGHFAKFLSSKLGMKEAALRRTLWGEYFYNPRTKRVSTKPDTAGKLKPMFVQFVLEYLWTLFDVFRDGADDAARKQRIITALGIRVPAHDLNNRDAKVALTAVMQQWLPLASAVLGMVITKLPSPVESQHARISKLWPGFLLPEQQSSEHARLQQAQAAVAACSANETAPLLAYVSKLVCVDGSDGDGHRAEPGQRPSPGAPSRVLVGSGAAAAAVEGDDRNAGSTVEEPGMPPVRFLAFARVFSGVLRVGDHVHVLGPRYDPSDPEHHRETVEIKQLFLMMSRDMVPVSRVPAGAVCGIAGLDGVVLKTATLTSEPSAYPMRLLHYDAPPILRVSVEPTVPAQMPQLIAGLHLLNKSDPCVDILLQETGEHVLVASGEMHLEHCLKELKERFARIDLAVSEPIVPFRETIAAYDPERGAHKTSQAAVQDTANKQASLSVRAEPLPASVLDVLSARGDAARRLLGTGRSSGDEEASVEEAAALRAELIAAAEEAGGLWPRWIKRIWATGPRRVGLSALIMDVEDLLAVFPSPLDPSAHTTVPTPDADNTVALRMRDVGGSVLTGFQLAAQAGPLCDEPISGVAFILEHVAVASALSDASAAPEAAVDGAGHAAAYGPFSGQVMSAMKEACRRAFLTGNVRLMEPVYRCEIVSSVDALGKAYAVLGSRRSQVLSEEMREGSAVFEVEALLPVVESFGFITQLRTKTSGAASPQLIFSHYATIDVDPFFVPTTQDELEDIGEVDYSDNVAKKYINAVRRRKGLLLEEKIVESAEKQRTLGRNK